MGIKPIPQDKNVCPGHKNAELKPFHCLFCTDRLCHPCIDKWRQNLSNFISILFPPPQYILTWLVSVCAADSCPVYYTVKVFISS